MKSPGKTKIDLAELLLFIREHQERPLIKRVQARFDVSERAARDAVRVLVKGGWVEEYRLLSDNRQKRYRLTATGHAAAQDIRRARRALNQARQKYSTIRHSVPVALERRAGSRNANGSVALRRERTRVA